MRHVGVVLNRDAYERKGGTCDSLQKNQDDQMILADVKYVNVKI